MTELENKQLQALKKCRLRSYPAQDKTFVQSLAVVVRSNPSTTITVKEAKYLSGLVVSYRRQINDEDLVKASRLMVEQLEEFQTAEEGDYVPVRTHAIKHAAETLKPDPQPTQLSFL